MAGKLSLNNEFTDWAVSCGVGVFANPSSCSMFARMLVVLDPLRIAAIAVTVFPGGDEVSVRLASDAPFPTRGRVRVDTLPALETKDCSPNACTFVGAVARQLIEEFKTGATFTALYDSPRGVFEDRLPLETFAAKFAQLPQR